MFREPLRSAAAPLSHAATRVALPLLSGGLLTITQLLVGSAPAWAQTAPACAPGQPAQFALGFADLKQRLGARMGDPVECQHQDPGTGDTVQHTSTGLGYVPSGTSVSSFTNGWEHYALMDNQVVLWRNASVSPPQPSAQDAAYIQQTLPLRTRLDQLDEMLGTIEQQGRAGVLDDVDQTDLGTIVSDLTTIGDELTNTATPPDLAPYAQRWVQVQQGDLGAATALVQARLTQVPEERATNLSDAATQIQARKEAREAATFALSQVLPVSFTPLP